MVRGLDVPEVDPASYYGERFPGIKGSGWVNTICPFHDDYNPSLSINLEHGGFKCWACGESGGDVLEFHRKIHGLTFKEAVDDLGRRYGRAYK